jgi:soluble lytic murein transglycosylase-like protein
MMLGKDLTHRPARPGSKLLAAVLLGLALLLPRTTEAFCFEEAGEAYGVPPGLLWAIAKVESNFNPAAVCYNRNGSYDYGVMQINSSWANKLGLRLWNSLNDPCTNVKVGAWILADCLGRYGYTREGIGCYNAISPDKRDAYASNVITVLEQMRKIADTRKN